MFSSVLRFFCLCCFFVAPPLAAQWSPPVDLFTQPSLGDIFPQVVVDSNGNATAVWAYDDGTNYTIQSSSKPFGGSWQAIPDTISQFDQDSYYPQIAVDTNGTVTAVWESYDGSYCTIQASSKSSGGVWLDPAIISPPDQNSSSPQIAVSTNGTATAVWESYYETNYIIQSSYRPFERDWQTPETIPSTGQDSHYPQIAVDTNSNATAVWICGDWSNYTIQASYKPFEESWQTPDIISSTSSTSYDPQIAVDSNGNATAVWESGFGPNYTIQASYKPFEESWQAPNIISSSDLFLLSPQIAVDSNGNATAVWESGFGPNYTIQASYKPVGKSWQTPDIISSSDQVSFSPQIAVDSNGNATAVWISGDWPNFIIQSSYKPFEGSWRTPETISQVVNSAYPQIAVDPKGNAVVVWELLTSPGEEQVSSIVQAVTFTPPNPTPLPPCKFRGVIHKKKHAHKRHYHLKAHWTPSRSPNIKKYRIYKRSKVVRVVKANRQLKFKTHLFWRSSGRKFNITAVNTNHVESEHKKLRVKHTS